MAELAEYTYNERDDHLTEAEALGRYAVTRREDPTAIVVLRDLDCGHWQVKTYSSEAEKNAFLRNRLESMVRMFWSALRLPAKP